MSSINKEKESMPWHSNYWCNIVLPLHPPLRKERCRPIEVRSHWILCLPDTLLSVRAPCTCLTPGQVNAFLSLCVSVSVSLPLLFSAKLEAVTHSAELHHWQAEAPPAGLQVLISSDSFISFNLGGGKALFLKQIAGKGSLVLVPSHFLQQMDSCGGE